MLDKDYRNHWIKLKDYLREIESGTKRINEIDKMNIECLIPHVQTVESSEYILEIMGEIERGELDEPESFKILDGEEE